MVTPPTGPTSPPAVDRPLAGQAKRKAASGKEEESSASPLLKKGREDRTNMLLAPLPTARPTLDRDPPKMAESLLDRSREARGSRGRT